MATTLVLPGRQANFRKSEIARERSRLVRPNTPVRRCRVGGVIADLPVEAGQEYLIRQLERLGVD
jgi:hypothetical protein